MVLGGKEKEQKREIVRLHPNRKQKPRVCKDARESMASFGVGGREARGNRKGMAGGEPNQEGKKPKDKRVGSSPGLLKSPHLINLGESSKGTKEEEEVEKQRRERLNEERKR